MTDLERKEAEIVALKGQLAEMKEALLLYHEAWNGCEGDWHKAMKTASAYANHVLWPKEYDEDGQKRQTKRRVK